MTKETDIQTDVKANTGFQGATGEVVGVRTEIDGTVSPGPRALGPEDMARLLEGTGATKAATPTRQPTPGARGLF